MGLTEKHRLRLRDIEGYAVCADSDEACMADLHLLQGLALTHGRPLLGFSRLKAMALASMSRAPVGTTLVPLLPGPLGLRAALYRQDVTGKLEELSREDDFTLASFLARVAPLRSAVGFGTGYYQHEAVLRTVLPCLPEASEPGAAFDLEALAAASFSALRSARTKRSAREIFAVNPSNSTAVARTPAAFTEWM